ncbi:MAG: glycosyltransferase 87 family protein [Catenulispora sp.]
MMETISAAPAASGEPGGPDRPAKQTLTTADKVLLAGLSLFAISLTAWIIEVNRHQDMLWSPLDLGVYWEGGRAVWHGTHLYDLSYTWVHLPFTYPPFSAGVFAVAAHLPLAMLAVLVAAVDLLTLVVAAWIALGTRTWATVPARLGSAFAIAAFGLWLEPVQQTLDFGQVNIVLMLLVLLDLKQDDRRWTKGIGVGLAAGFKLTPAIFIAYLLVTRRFRAAATALAMFAATIGVTWIALPSESHRYWIGRLFTDSSRVGNAAYVGDQSLHGVISRLMDGSGDKLFLGLAALVAIGGLALAAWAHRYGDEVLAILLTAATGLLVSPISWTHHWVWIVPFAGWLVAQRTFAMALWLRITLCAGLFAAFTAWPYRTGPGGPRLPLGWLWFLPHTNDGEYKWSIGQHLAGEMYTIIGALTLAAVATAVYRRRKVANPA